MRRFNNKLLKCTIILTILLLEACFNSSLDVEYEKNISLPEGSEVIKARVQFDKENNPEPVIIYKKDSESNVICVYPTTFEIELDVKDIAIGKEKGDILIWGFDEQYNTLLFSGELDSSGLINIKTVDLPAKSEVVLCENGKDYAYTYKNSLNLNGETIYKSNKYGFPVYTGKRLLKPEFSPDGKRLVIAEEEKRFNKEFISVRDLLDKNDYEEDITMLFPVYRDLEDISFDFGPDNILRIHYKYGEITGVREEDSFISDEYYSNSFKDYDQYLLKRSLVYNNSYSPSGFYFRGINLAKGEHILDYSVNDDYSDILLYTVSDVANNNEFYLNVRRNNKILLKEKIVQKSLNEMISFNDNSISYDSLKEDIYHKMKIIKNSTTILAVSIPTEDSKKHSYVKIGNKKFRDFQDFRLFDLNKNTAYVLEDGNNKHHLFIDNKRFKRKYDRLFDVATTNNSLYLLAKDENNYTLSKAYYQLKSIENKKMSIDSSIKLPAVRDLNINDYSNYNDMFFLGTNRGLFVSSDQGNNWEHYTGYELDITESSSKFEFFLQSGDLEYLLKTTIYGLKKIIFGEKLLV